MSRAAFQSGFLKSAMCAGYTIFEARDILKYAEGLLPEGFMGLKEEAESLTSEAANKYLTRHKMSETPGLDLKPMPRILPHPESKSMPDLKSAPETRRPTQRKMPDTQRPDRKEIPVTKRLPSLTHPDLARPEFVRPEARPMPYLQSMPNLRPVPETKRN